MTNSVPGLLQTLTLERLDENLYRGESRDIGGHHLFGGQLLGQALLAASQTVEGRGAHSMHGYFLRPGDKSKPVIYEVDRIRNGRSYATRRVVAIQHGNPIFNMSASFQLREEGLEHQIEMPDVPGPDVLPDMTELFRQKQEEVPERLARFLARQRPIEFRHIDPVHPIEPEPRPPFRQIWFRVDAGLPDDPAIHKALLAYASDFSLLGTALLPHALTFLQGTIRAASLDHAMWFHRDFRVDEWLLYAMDSPSASHGRGFSRGHLFSRDGRLVASVTQEGMIRRI